MVIRSANLGQNFAIGLWGEMGGCLEDIPRCNQGPGGLPFPAQHHLPGQFLISQSGSKPLLDQQHQESLPSLGSHTMTPKQKLPPLSRVAQLHLETSHIRRALMLINLPWLHSICARWGQSQTSPWLHVEPVWPQTQEQGPNCSLLVGRDAQTPTSLARVLFSS